MEEIGNIIKDSAAIYILNICSNRKKESVDMVPGDVTATSL